MIRTIAIYARTIGPIWEGLTRFGRLWSGFVRTQRRNLRGLKLVTNYGWLNYLLERGPVIFGGLSTGTVGSQWRILLWHAILWIHEGFVRRRKTLQILDHLEISCPLNHLIERLPHRTLLASNSLQILQSLICGHLLLLERIFEPFVTLFSNSKCNLTLSSAPRRPLQWILLENLQSSFFVICGLIVNDLIDSFV